jgi:hypothetical protein
MNGHSHSQQDRKCPTMSGKSDSKISPTSPAKSSVRILSTLPIRSRPASIRCAILPQGSQRMCGFFNSGASCLLFDEERRNPRGRCPRTPEICRFEPIAWQENQATCAPRRAGPSVREAYKIPPDGFLFAYLSRRGAAGNLGCAAEEDRALLRSNPSASAVQWHGDAALVGRRSLFPCYWPKAKNLRGLGTESPRGTRGRGPATFHSLRSLLLDGRSIVVRAVYA